MPTIAAVGPADPGWTAVVDLSHFIVTSLQEEPGVELGSQGPHSPPWDLSLGPRSQEFYILLNCFAILCILKHLSFT